MGAQNARWLLRTYVLAAITMLSVTILSIMHILRYSLDEGWVIREADVLLPYIVFHSEALQCYAEYHPPQPTRGSRFYIHCTFFATLAAFQAPTCNS